MDKQKYYLEKLSGRKTGYPLATIAFYGPDDQFASKVVVAIITSESASEPENIRKWFAVDKDIRLDVSILHEMLEFIQENRVHRVAMPDRVIGCPHEEGIDYPEGEVCPECLFWANRDRWTGEIIG